MQLTRKGLQEGIEKAKRAIKKGKNRDELRGVAMYHLYEISENDSSQIMGNAFYYGFSKGMEAKKKMGQSRRQSRSSQA